MAAARVAMRINIVRNAFTATADGGGVPVLIENRYVNFASADMPKLKYK